MTVASAADVAVAAGRTAGAALAAARPRQWTKNLLLFAGLLFAARLGDAARWLDAVGAFLAYSAVSSASYLVNDVRDAPADRLHPVKRRRPIARGDLDPRAALALAGVLALAGGTIAAALGTAAFALLACFAALQLAYTLRLKRLPLVDVAVIAVFFVIRAAAGADAVHVRISPWLLACTALLALFLGLAKRRGELVLVARGDAPGRAALGGYSARALDRMLWATLAATVGAYAVYAAVARDSLEMLVTVPAVVVGVGRYAYLVHRRDLGEEPEHVLLSDRVVLASVGVWVVAAALVLTSS